MDGEHRARVLAAYRAWAGSYDRLLRRTYHRVERALTRRHLSGVLPERPDGRILDAGGGDGRQAIALLSARRGGAAVVADLSAEMLVLARRRAERSETPADLVCADVGALPFPARAFDTILLLGGVLSHCADPAPALLEARRLLCPGGHAVVSVDNLAVGVRTACRERCADALRDVLREGRAPVFHQHPFPFAVRFFTPDELRDALRTAGFRVLSLIGKPVFTHFAWPREVLSAAEVEARVEAEWPFVREERFLPFADQLEAVAQA